MKPGSSFCCACGQDTAWSGPDVSHADIHNPGPLASPQLGARALPGSIFKNDCAWTWTRQDRAHKCIKKRAHVGECVCACATAFCHWRASTPLRAPSQPPTDWAMTDAGGLCHVLSSTHWQRRLSNSRPRGRVQRAMVLRDFAWWWATEQWRQEVLADADPQTMFTFFGGSRGYAETSTRIMWGLHVFCVDPLDVEVCGTVDWQHDDTPNPFIKETVTDVVYCAGEMVYFGAQRADAQEALQASVCDQLAKATT